MWDGGVRFPVSALPSIPRILSEMEDRKVMDQLSKSEAKVEHFLIVKPFAWLAQYGITEAADIERIRQRVIVGVRANEAEYRAARLKSRKAAIGAQALKRLEFFKPHTPKARERRIFLICEDRERRIWILELFKSIFDCCRDCYDRAKQGLRTEWPPGTFVPWLPPTLGATIG